MTTSKVLVLTIPPLEPEAADRLATELDRAGKVVKVVSPASKLSRLGWLTNDEDDARSEAEQAAAAASDAVAADGKNVDAEVGDVDPLQAVEDALRTFSADSLVVVLPSAENASWLDEASVDEGFERFGLPVEYVLPDGSAIRR